MKDSWQSGDAYEQYMGRWSALVADLFLDWLSPGAGLRWLDVGCGSGALSRAVVKGRSPQSVTAIDQSKEFVNAAQERLGSRARCKVGNALSLPVEDSSVDIAVSGLVLNFIPEPEKALAEMKRVTAKGGMVAVYIWDYAGTMDFLIRFWDAAVELDPGAAALHEGQRFPDSNAAELDAAFRRVGFASVETSPLDIMTRFTDFEDYWKPFLGGQGPAPTYVANLADGERGALKEALMRNLPVQRDGSIQLAARAWAARGLV